jgi:YesN/AraC family two-component response regulator
MNDQIQKALDYIAAHYSEENLDLNSVANFVCLNPAYFSSLLKKETGMSFVKLLTKFRVNKAEDLLKNSADNITQVAYKTGFGSLSNFNKSFKKINKIPPKDFRETNNLGNG